MFFPLVCAQFSRKIRPNIESVKEKSGKTDVLEQTTTIMRGDVL